MLYVLVSVDVCIYAGMWRPEVHIRSFLIILHIDFVSSLLLPIEHQVCVCGGDFTDLHHCEALFSLLRQGFSV